MFGNMRIDGRQRVVEETYVGIIVRRSGKTDSGL